MTEALKRATETVKFLVGEVLKEGDLAVDMTCGNGHDTLFLAQTVGESGNVYAIDIQQSAIEKTRDLLKKEGCLENVVLVQDDHVNIDKILGEKKAKAIVFNLGYLPGTDHEIKTGRESTVGAVKKAIASLAPGGILTICTYSHKEGKREREALLKELEDLTGEYNAYILKRLNRDEPPYVLVVTRDL